MNNIEIMKSALPDKLDCITVEYRGVTVDIYQVLHGISGGTNQDYVSFVNSTLEGVGHPIYCEKSMHTMYKFVDHDVRDWAVMRTRDTFALSLKAYANPLNLASLVRIFIKEKMTKSSRYGRGGYYSLADIGGERRFHALCPFERREMCGFPDPYGYFLVNHDRWHSKCNFKVYFLDPDWSWLSSFEPHVNIPYRSIYMIEYIVEKAKVMGQDHVAFVVGEIHGSDIAFYTDAIESDTLPSWLKSDATKLTKLAHEVQT